MAKRLTVHMKDSPRESWIEVDGERVEEIESVVVNYLQRSPDGLINFTVTGRVGFVNETGESKE